MRAAWLAASLAVLGTPANPATVPDDEFVQVVRPFLNTYCIRCHGPEKQKADRRFDLLAGVPSDGKGTVELWQDILDQLNLGEMPPEDTKNKPSVDEVRKVIAWATSGLGKAYAARTSTGGRTVLRRLNRQEYRHSVGELLALDPGIEDPTERFPPDERNHGFDNIGASLVMSDYLLVQYLEAAEALIDRALVEGPRPPSKKVRFRAPFHFDRAYDRLEKAGGYQNIQQNPIQDHGVLWLSKFRGGVPHSGRYTVRFKAEGVNRDYPYDEESLHVSKDQPLRIGILPGSRARGDLKERLGTDRHAAEFVLPEDGPKWFETTIWLDAGYQPRFTFPNGPNNWKHLRWVLVRKYPDRFRKLIDGYLTPYDWSHPEFVGADRREQWPERAAEILGPKGVDTHGAEVVEKWKKWVRLRKRGFNLVSTRKAWDQYSECYEGPLIRLYEVEIEGPHYDVWPPASHRAVLGELEPTLENAEAILRRFAERAFRRPVREGELDPVLRLVRARAEEGGRPLDALKAGLKAVLASPGFIYLEEGSGPLGDHALASRLSYFLWSSPPDAELRSIADRGALRTPETLRAQAERLLRDPRSGRLARSFTERWLELYKIGTMPPTVLQHPRYFTGRLESAMKKETRLYFRHLLEENLPVDRFLASDFTFVDGSLAHH